MSLFPKRAGGSAAPSLGHLELALMEILWRHGESNVRAVCDLLERPLAYTTVMTTLDRLYKKGLLARRKVERAFVYAPLATREQLEQTFVAGLLSASPASRALLVSYLVERVGPEDGTLLDALEEKIRQRREALGRERKPS